MKLTKKLKQALEEIKSAAALSGDLKVTISSDKYEVHWYEMQLSVDNVEDLVKGLNAFAKLELLGAKPF